jgi:hypothetical protein
MMKQALRVAFGFLMLWAAVLHAEVRIEITQGGLGTPNRRCTVPVGRPGRCA